MAIAYVASAISPTSFPGGSNNTSTCIINKPTGTLDGHVMIAFIQTGGGVNISAPGGWTLIDTHSHAGGANLTNSIYYKVASSEGSSYTFTDDSGGATPLTGAIATWSGVDTSAPINAEASSETNGTDTVGTPNVTTTADCVMLHYRVGKTSEVGSQGNFVLPGGSGWTQKFNNANRGLSTQYFCELDTIGDTTVSAGLQSGAAATFNADHSLTGSIERQIGLRANVPPTNAPATVAPVTATAYQPSSFTVGTDSAYSPVTATAYGATVLTGVAAEDVGFAAATATAYDAAGWVIHPVDVGAVAFDASVAIETMAEVAPVTVAAANQVGYFGAPASRRYTVPAESREYRVEAE